MIEIAIISELLQITELNNEVYPNSAPEATPTPYLTITNVDTSEEYTLDGVTGNRTTLFNLNLYCSSYSDLKNIGQKVRDKLLSFFQRNVGNFFIQSANLDTRDLYEDAVNLHRTIFEFEIYY